MLTRTGCWRSCSTAVTNWVAFSTRMTPSSFLIVLSLELPAVPHSPAVPCDHLILIQNTLCSAADCWWLASTYADIMSLRNRRLQLFYSLPHYGYTDLHHVLYWDLIVALQKRFSSSRHGGKRPSNPPSFFSVWLIKEKIGWSKYRKGASGYFFMVKLWSESEGNQCKPPTQSAHRALELCREGILHKPL